MKSKFCFIRDFGRMRPNSFVYVVWVGESDREQTKLALVQEYCKDCSIYFKKWSSLVDSALNEASKQFQVNGNVLAKPFRSESISIHDLYRLIVDDSFDSFEANHVETPFGIWMAFRNDPKYIQSRNQSNVLQDAPPHKRQNLSRRKLTDGKRAALAVAGVISLLILDVIMSNVLNLLFPLV